DATDTAAESAYNDFVRKVFSPFKVASQAMNVRLLAVVGKAPAPEHAQMVRRLWNEADLFREANIAIEAEISALVGAYGRRVAALGGDEVREREAFDSLFLELVALRRQLARNAGLSDYRAYRWREMNRLDYTPADCRQFHDAIEAEIVPLAARLRAAK